MPVLSVRHVTTYRYSHKVSLGEHRLMFRPRDSWDQRLLDAKLAISPEPSSIRWVHDVFGNCVTVVKFARRASELRFESTIRLVHSPTPALDFPIAQHAQTYPFSYDPEEMPDLLRSIERQYPDRDYRLYEWARQFVNGAGSTGTYKLLAAMTHSIRKNFAYVGREEMGIQSPLETLERTSGSCRDFAVLMIEAVRSLGLAARFVSGYLHIPAMGERQYSGGGSTHAWVQVYIPGAGWLEFDPTNGIAGNRNLIRVAVARDPIQAVPIWGTWTGFPSASLGLDVEVHITESVEESAPLAGSAKAEVI
jgi:transglutaminase-like putative cysteine protease